ncbi:hypothetical protein [Lewinella sp. W8]|uniref:hypothetical protein n=1 Tax=Lewinella sp. W8 TaxID=2528208 RepID=UPI001067DDDC|nr:hypothetical protein [Lewinella sp. W8]MTB53066.1 hypothetical protein [Lewinella sp. W8]
MIASPSGLADWLVEIGEPVPDHAVDISFPCCFPYEVFEHEDAEPGYTIHPCVPLSAFDLENAEEEMAKLDCWFAEFVERGSPIEDFPKLMKANARMARGLKAFGVQVARLETEERNARYRRETKEARLQQYYRQNNESAKAADLKAKEECKEEYDYLTDIIRLRRELQAAFTAYKQTVNTMAGVRSAIKNEYHHESQVQDIG